MVQVQRLLAIWAFVAQIPAMGQAVGRAVPPARAALDFLNHNRPVLDAHNCYPYKGDWADRIDRALKTGFPVGIEQDVAWGVDHATGKGRPVVSHSDKTTGSEPALRDYFFERIRPIVEEALARNDRARWPVIVLHFDFKSNEAPLLHAMEPEARETALAALKWTDSLWDDRAGFIWNTGPAEAGSGSQPRRQIRSTAWPIRS